jgi:hypothetical protein
MGVEAGGLQNFPNTYGRLADQKVTSTVRHTIRTSIYVRQTYVIFPRSFSSFKKS